MAMKLPVFLKAIIEVFTRLCDTDIQRVQIQYMYEIITITVEIIELEIQTTI
jgi:hypothetical protein